MPVAEAAPLDILYDDADLLAVNKPPGIVVHPTYKHDRGTLLNALMWRARDWPPPMRPSILGRLDKLTSGVTLVAKTAGVHAALQRALASRASRKEYLAVVYGSVVPASGAIALALRHQEGDAAGWSSRPAIRKPRRASRNTSGRPPLTRPARGWRSFDAGS